MTDPAQASLLTFWERVHESVLALAQHTWAHIAEHEPDLWASGRDLTAEEGVGFQGQFTHPGPFAASGIVEVRLVIQWELARGRTGLFWVIEAMPALLTDEQERVFLHCYRWRVPYRNWHTATEITLQQVVPAANRLLSQLRAKTELPVDRWIENTEVGSRDVPTSNDHEAADDREQPPQLR